MTLNPPPAVRSPDKPLKAPCHNCILPIHTPHDLKGLRYLPTPQVHPEMCHLRFRTCTGFFFSYLHTAAVLFPVLRRDPSLPDQSRLPYYQYPFSTVPYRSKATSAVHHTPPSGFLPCSAHSVYY